MRPLHVAIAALAVASVVVVTALWSAEDATLSTNGINPAVFVRDLGVGKRICEAGPAPTNAVRSKSVLAVVAGGYDLDVRLRLETVGRRVLAARGQPAEGGKVVFTFAGGELGSIEKFCLRNAGRGPVALAGERFGSDPSAWRVSLTAEDPTPESWLEKAPAAVSDVGAARGAPVGRASGLLVVLLASVGAALAVVVVAVAGFSRKRSNA